PFFSDLATWYPPYFLLLTMNLSVCLFCLVLRPWAILPHGVIGILRPTGALPSPPPCGWSLGFIVTPRTVGRTPSRRFRPALPSEIFSWSRFPIWPMVALFVCRTKRISVEGSLIRQYLPSLAMSCAPVPALRTS